MVASYPARNVVGQGMRIAWIVIALTACKSDPVKCEQGIRNYAQLVYWDQADAEIAAAPVAQRDALRKDKLAKFQADMERGLQIEVSKCTSANFGSQIDCMNAAKTAKQAKACIPD
jgi:hypothetical protein